MKKLIPIAVIALMVAGCYNDKYDKLYPAPVVTVDPCDTAKNEATYSGNVMGIMTQSCTTAGCHDAGTASGGYDLTQYDQVKTAANNGLLVSDITSGNMPQGMAKLSECKIAQVKNWVDHGAKNN
jgi:hypothetical protein